MPKLMDKMETGKGQESKGSLQPAFSGGRHKFSEGYTCDFIYPCGLHAQKIFEVLNGSKGRFELELGEVLTSDRNYTIERFSLNDLEDKKGTGIGTVEVRKEADGEVTAVYLSAPPRVLFSIKEMAGLSQNGVE